MKCIDCDKDACMILKTSYVLEFAFCKKCILKRKRKKRRFPQDTFEVDDLHKKWLEEKNGKL